MKALLALAGLSLVLLSAACGPLDVPIPGPSGSGTIADLWPDVPAMPGAVKTDLGEPTLKIQFISNILFAGAPLDYIFFQTAGTQQDVRDFYALARMTPLGWDAGAPGCDLDKLPQYRNIAAQFTDGWVCFFNKKQGEKTTDGLLIIIVPDPANKQTLLTYGRIRPGGPATPAK